MFLSGVDCHSVLQGIFPTQGLNRVTCIAGRFFVVWATRAASFLSVMNVYLIFTNLPLLCFLHSVQFSCSVMSGSLWPHGHQHTRPPCPSPTPRAHSNSRPSSWWCRPTISSSVVPFSSCLQSFSTSESFQMSQLFASGGQSIGVSASASVLPMNTQDWPLR